MNGRRSGMTKNNPVQGIGACLVVLATLANLLLLGCTPSRYRKSADDEVYKILGNRSEGVLGARLDSSIDTTFSSRSPSDVNGSEIIFDRNQSVPDRFLSLRETLDLAVKANRSYQYNREKLYLQALSLTGTRHQFAFKFTSASADFGFARDTDGDVSKESDADATVSKLLKTGGTLTASLANDLVLYFNGKPKVPSLTMSLAKPLLRGAGADIASEILTQAERDVVYEIRTFSHFQKEFAVEVVNDYLDLLQQGESLRLSYNNYTNRIFFREEIEARVEAGLAAEFEAKQAKQSEYSSKLAYLSAINTFQTSLDDFKQKLSLPLGGGVRLDFKVLEDLKELGLPQIPVTEATGYRLATTNRLDVLNVIDQFEDSKRKVKVARQDLLPSLSLVADVSLKDQFYSSFEHRENSRNAGLKIDLPLDQLPERNAYRSSLIAFERQMRTLAKELDNLLDGIRADLRNLKLQRQNYFTELEARKNAEENLQATQQRLRVGFPGVRTRDIITAQDALLQAQLSVSRASVRYHKIRLKILKDMGILDTSQDEFWLKEFQVPGAEPVLPAPPGGAPEDVIPPDDILGEQP
ncbi:MAG: TolC family protein [Opitutales bacterium]